MTSTTPSEKAGDTSTEGNMTKAASRNSSRQWREFNKNPRIVRVSRSFGGKDRHSKVCTIRGLRDRRIRLSVPTAIQVYDLQDKLGLNQPSKVIDWLLDESKTDIDQLPPLQFGVFGNTNNHDPILYPNSSNSFNYKELGFHHEDPNHSDLRQKGKEFVGDHDDQETQKLFPEASVASFPTLFNGEAASSQMVINHGLLQNSNIVNPMLFQFQLPLLPLPSPNHHPLFGGPTSIGSLYSYPPYLTAPLNSQFQLLNSQSPGKPSSTDPIILQNERERHGTN